MSEKKLYLVEVELRVTVPVLAKDEHEAEEIARESAEEEPSWGLENADISAGLPLEKCPKDYVGVIPWGGDGDETMDQLLPVAEDR